MAKGEQVGTGEAPHRALEAELTRLVRRSHSYRTPGPTLERGSYAVLDLLVERGPVRASDLAPALDLDLSTVSRQVSGLIEAGLVLREADPRDGRAHLLVPSAQGRVLLHRVREQRRNAVREVVHGWEPAEVRSFAGMLARFNDAAEVQRAAAVGGPSRR